MEGETQNNRLKTKFINLRTIEGESGIEQLEYARELFETFGMKDPRFSGAVIHGSTVKGYSFGDNSDIDVAIFYYENETPKLEGLFGSVEEDNYTSSHILYTFNKFKYEFELKRRQEKKKIFHVDFHLGPTLKDSFKINQLGEIGFILDNSQECVEIFDELSYLIIETKNSNALMPMKKVLGAIKEVVRRLNKEQKIKLLNKILERANYYFRLDFMKYRTRIKENHPVKKEEYIESRIKMLKQQLKSKFGLDI